ncbi:uncharacterized protein LOC126371107 [Pectinophora gossypiella]|uniref:uncharacterized protein LOC126371107 n=1 Tax=Pectinophora gossypiella TaxID=13191 RepID=UPI00214E9A4D|nr:uncharacterized protein LOC126371107 [Pectinophora gossypiella]
MRLCVCLCVLVLLSDLCNAQFNFTPSFRYEYTTPSPVPFPTCRADNIDCLRRGLRTFFFLMDSGHLGMTPVDPMVVNSVAISLPDQNLSILMRRVNVTGARWTRLVDRKFNLEGGRSGVRFSSDLHLTGEMNMKIHSDSRPHSGVFTMDISNVESNITYPWSGERDANFNDYILIGKETIAVRNTRIPTFFMHQDASTDLDMTLTLSQQSVLDHLANEVTSAVMHSVMDNFRLFARKVPVKYYYGYFK